MKGRSFDHSQYFWDASKNLVERNEHAILKDRALTASCFCQRKCQVKDSPVINTSSEKFSYE